MTPAVQDAAWQLGYAIARSGDPSGLVMLISGDDVLDVAIEGAIEAGFDAFTPEAEAVRIEAARTSYWALMDRPEQQSINNGRYNAEWEAVHIASKAQVHVDSDEYRDNLARWRSEFVNCLPGQRVEVPASTEASRLVGNVMRWFGF